MLAVATVLAAAPADAQLASLRSSLGIKAIVPPAVTSPLPGGSVITPGMNTLILRAMSNEARATNNAALIAQANAAARAAAQSLVQTVPNGLGAGGLDPVKDGVSAANDPTGIKTWQGANQPVQTTSGSAVNVTIDQTESRALLSWNTFNVGRDTTVTFNQKAAGKPQTSWVAVNRVVGQIDPATGRIDPSQAPKPSQILGAIKADGTVVVLNQAGVLFGATSQVNLHSLLVSSLELGAATVHVNNVDVPTTLAQRNSVFLQSGILPTQPAVLISAVGADGVYGAVSVQSGAQINSTGAGFVILTAPQVNMAGEITTDAGGQVSLQAGQVITALPSTGAATSVDPYVRGLVLASPGTGNARTAADVANGTNSVTVSGSIAAPQGYISLGSSDLGTISMSGVLSSTTSVSRDGKISLDGGTIVLTPLSTLIITPDVSTATIPQSADSVAAFKTSQIDIGAHQFLDNPSPTLASLSTLLPAMVTIDNNALIYAPSATVNIGGTAGSPARLLDEPSTIPTGIRIGAGAIIDVSGIADLLLPASRNSLEISPAKRNELRDTPTYRDPATGDEFTLNGATLYVDPRITGVRSDGVAWVGSPLIEAGSAAAQIGVTASELMTKGGNVTMAVRTSAGGLVTDLASIPRVVIDPDATIDVSGGWVHYQEGLVRTSNLLTADGRIVNIANADPNDDYVAVSGDYTVDLPQTATDTTYASSLVDSLRYSPEYTEGRDAGTITIRASAATISGQIHADAFAGAQQIASAREASAISKIAGDGRKVQASAAELPSGGLLRFQGTAFSGDVVVTPTAAPAIDDGTTYINDTTINQAGLSGLAIQASGAVTFASGSNVELAAGGALDVMAGRTIRFDGTVSAPGGSIAARTYDLPVGSIFSDQDDQPILPTGTTDLPSGLNFDVIVDGTLSTAGRWVNDSLVSNGQFDGRGYTDGGSISLTVAPHVTVQVDATTAIDVSGSIDINSTAFLDVTSGGYVSAAGVPTLTAKGGDVSLINETVYAQLGAVPGQQTDPFASSYSAFQVTPDATHLIALTPSVITSHVSIAPGTIAAFGFGGSGTFTLVTPDLNFGGHTAADGSVAGTILPLDFVQQTGFGALNLTAWKTLITGNVFANGLTTKTALFDTTRLIVGAGETLNLTQRQLPNFLTLAQTGDVQSLRTGSRIASLASLTPITPTEAWDQRPVNLTLGGLTELDVLTGGTIIGAPGAAITLPALYSDGTISIAGGSITQALVLPASYGGNRPAFAVRGGIDGLSAIFGPADADGLYDENAANALGIVSTDTGLVLSNRDLVAQQGQDRQIYLTGLVGPNDGIDLGSHSVTDLSGASIRNPRAGLLNDGTQRATGRLLDGGSIRLLGTFAGTKPLFSTPSLGNTPYNNSPGSLAVPLRAQLARRLDAAAGARIDLSGASDSYDISYNDRTFTHALQWSKGGTLSALGGGTISGAIIDAHGGAASAQAGTLEWFDPTLRQSDDGTSDALSADQIEAAGFDSFVAGGTLTTDGDVDLHLGRSFLLRSIDFTGSASDLSVYGISVSGDGALSIAAPYIAFTSALQSATYPALPEGTATGSATFTANAIDVTGAVAFDPSLAQVSFLSTGDFRLIGAQTLAQTFGLAQADGTQAQSLSGQLLFGGDATIRARQVYATTGTGNLQQYVDYALLTDAQKAAATTVLPAPPYLIASLGTDATIRFERASATTPGLPYSAGSYLAIQAPHIEQAGIIRAPLGRLDFGMTDAPLIALPGNFVNIAEPLTVDFEAGSVTTVSADGLKIPYGTTTDLTEYFFSPVSGSPLTAPPGAELRAAGGTITIAPGATIDASGGGDVFAYEFVPGVGGSRDVLSRFNTDPYSGNDGYQFADQRQVYAIVPGLSADSVAAVDPIYSADYANLYGSDVGKSVYLDSVPGLAPGYYTLLPAHYALLDGGYRVVENVGAGAPAVGTSIKQLDGSYLVGGNYGVAGTSIAESQRRSFTIETAATFLKYSDIKLTSGSTNFANAAAHAGTPVPQLPLDAARVVLSPINGLVIGEKLVTDPAKGGRGAKVDISGTQIAIVSDGSAPEDGVVTLTTSDIANLGAASLLIGGVRTDKSDGTTDVAITATSIRVATTTENPLTAPEIILAADGAVSSGITIEDGASLVATGTLVDTRSGDFDVTTGTNSGSGELLRLASGTERLVDRTGPAASDGAAALTIGNASFTGGTLTLDSSQAMAIADGAVFKTPLLALGANRIDFASAVTGVPGVLITPTLEASMIASGVQRLTLRSPRVVGFAPGGHGFNDLVIDAPGLALIRPQGTRQIDPLTTTITAGAVTFSNDFADGGDCKRIGVTACGKALSLLDLQATSLTFGSGAFHTYGYDGAVTLTGSAGSYYQGQGSFDVGGAALTMNMPFLVDRAPTEDPNALVKTSVQPKLTLATTGAFVIAAPELATGATAPKPNGSAAPGATLEIGTTDAPVASASIDGALLRATAGTLAIRSTDDISVTGAAELATPGYSRTFGSADDKVTVSAPGGSLGLVSLSGDIAIDPTAKLTIGGGSGQAGALLLAADQGSVSSDLNIDAKAPDGKASLTFDSGKGAFDLAGFVTDYGAAFGGDIAIRTGAGGLALNAGQTIKATSVSLTQEDAAGAIDIAGRIDTSGTIGGDIALYGAGGVRLASTAAIDAHANGYGVTDTRQASAGDVVLGTSGNGAIDVAQGATIDLGARMVGDRLIPKTQLDPVTQTSITTYSYVAADLGGTLTLRAPVVETNGTQGVNIDFAGTATGAREIVVQGYKSWDLGEVVQGHQYSGVTINGQKQAVLNLDTNGAKPNFLADNAAGTLVDFIQNFDISASNDRLGSLVSDAAFHERPGVELDYAGDIVLASNWNLGAGTVDVAGAVAAGLMRPSALGTYVAGGKRQQRYEVVPGAEAQIFQQYTSLTYRVGGKVDGEAGMLTLRAGGDLDIKHSISDGFFVFGDETDPAYVSSQLGGGKRVFQPALQVNCNGSCDSLVAFDPNATGNGPGLIISLNNVVRGTETSGSGIAPYSPSANAPGATTVGGSGDPIGTAQLFPLLADGSSAGSFSLQLVGGGGATPSVNPQHVDRVTAGNVSVTGENTYKLTVVKPTASYEGPLQLHFGSNTKDDRGTAIDGDFLNQLAEATGLPSETLGVTKTRIGLPTGDTAAARSIRKLAITYFNQHPGEAVFTGPDGAPTGFFASFASVLAFFQSSTNGTTVFERYQRAVEAGNIGKDPQPFSTDVVGGRVVHVANVIRTGTGSIEMAAAGDVDLRGTAKAVLRGPGGSTVGVNNTAGAQKGGAAVYTVGHLVVPHVTTATIAGTNQTLTVDPSDYAIPTDALTAEDRADYTPRADGALLANAVYADGGGSISITAGRDVLEHSDVWSQAYGGQNADSAAAGNYIGPVDQRWRVGAIGVDAAGNKTLATNIRVNPQLFEGGVGTFGGGNIAIHAGRDVSDMTAVIDTSVTTANIGSSFGSMTFGGGALDVSAGRDVLGGRYDVASGTGTIMAGGSIGSAGALRQVDADYGAQLVLAENLPQIRLTDATVALSATGTIDIAGIGSLGVRQGRTLADARSQVSSIGNLNAAGYYTPVAGVSLVANGDISMASQGTVTTLLARPDTSNGVDAISFLTGMVLPGSLSATSLAGDLTLSQSDPNALVAEAPPPILLYPSAIGQLSLYAGGTIAPVTLDMDDGDPSLLPGIFSAFNFQNQQITGGRPFNIPLVFQDTPDSTRRLYHNQTPTHLGDTQPVRIAADGDLRDLTLFLPKQARISAGRDIIDMVFNGQNLDAGDTTLISAGRDITATTSLTSIDGTPRSVLNGNQFVLGGPGALFIEAGRDLGPFLNSAVVDGKTYPGGILTVGNDYNPWLGSQGASIYTLFGVGKGANFDALRETYLDPANTAALDGDVFVQTTDVNGNASPDRTKPIYASALVAWLLENAPDALSKAFGGTISIDSTSVLPLLQSLDAKTLNQFLVDLPYLPQRGILSPQVAIDRTKANTPVLVTDASAVAAADTGERTYISGSILIGWLAQNAPDVLEQKFGVTTPSIAASYAQFVALPELRQRQALLDTVYFNELASTSRPSSPSYQQYVRGYRAVQTLFPASDGYTDNLSTYYTDPATVDANHPQGIARRILANPFTNEILLASDGNPLTDPSLAPTFTDPATGRPVAAAPLQATKVETGNLDLRLATIQTDRGGGVTLLAPGGNAILGSVVATATQAARRAYPIAQVTQQVGIVPVAAVDAIPIGYEGVLTLRGGQVNGFTDGDLRLNQSRLFTEQGGDITLWSSNGDLNAGQGAKTSASFPPVTVRFDPDGGSEVDVAGSVAGAGIAAFQPTLDIAAPSVTLIAPVGEVDAGDAGVRAAGDVFVAAARVANADNFKVGGQAIGVPSLAVATTPVVPASATAAVVANALRNGANTFTDGQTRITVDVMGYFDDGNSCEGDAAKTNKNCPQPN